MFLFILLFILAVFTFFFTTIFFRIYHQGQNATPAKSDVIIILGCKVNPSGAPSLLLQYRLEKALKLFRENYATKIIVSGGQGANEPMSEAKAMKDWLVANRVPESAIFIEDQSTDTFENLQFSKAVMEREGLKSAIIVTNKFHLYRSMEMAKGLRMQVSGSAAPSLAYLDPYNYSREILSVIKYWIFGN